MAVPTDFSGLVAWHKADALTLNDGDTVTSWTDSSGNNNHAVEYSGQGMPVFKTNIKNGLPIVRFAGEGTPQTLLLSTALAAWQNKGYCALFAVFRPDSATAKGDVMFVETGTGVGRAGFAVSETGYVGEFTLFGRRLDGDSAQFVHGGTVVAGNWYIVSVLIEWANAIAHIRVNGVATAESHAFQTAGNTSNTASWSVDIASSGGASFFDGDICELLWYNAQITEAQAAQLEAYLDGRWAVLPVDDSGTTKAPTAIVTSSATAPYDDNDWITPTNALANDGAYATARYTIGTAGPTGANNTLVTTNTVSPYDDLDWDDKTGVNAAGDSNTAGISSASFDTNTVSYLAKAQGFGFTVPAGATIVGIKVDIRKQRTAGTSAVDACVQLLDAAGALQGNNKADTTTNWPASAGTISYGGSADTWGATLNTTVVNDADFGVGIAVKATAQNVDINIDLVAITVYYAEATFDNGDYSYLLKAQGFGWNVPAAATITGIKVTIERKAAAGTIKDAIVKLLDASGAVQGNDKADTATAWPGSDTAKDYGGTGDTWGATLNTTVVEDPDFGVAIAVKAEADDSGADIDYISMTLYYATTTTYPQDVSGALTLAGLAVLQTAAAKAGSWSGAGVIVKQIAQAPAGALTSGGEISALRLMLTALDGTLTQAGAIVKQIAASGSGTLTSAGLLIKQAQSAIAGALTQAAIVINEAQRRLGGALTSDGRLGKQAPQTVAGTLTSTGAEVAQTNLTPAGALTQAGVIARQAPRALDGALTPSGAIVDETQRRLAGELTSSGAGVGLKGIVVLLEGTLTQGGAIAKQIAAALDGALTSGGAIVIETQRRLAGALTSDGALLPIKAALVNVSGALTSAGAIVIETQHRIAGALTSAGSIVRQIATSLNAELISSGAFATTIAVTALLEGALTSSGEIIKGMAASASGALTTSGALITQAGRNVAGALTSAGSIARASATSLSGSLTSSGEFATLVASLLSLAGELTSSGALIKTSAASISGGLTQAGASVNQTIRNVAGALTSSGDMVRSKLALLDVTGALTQAGAIVGQAARNLAGTLNSGGVLIKQVRSALTGALTQAGAIAIETRRALAGVWTGAGALSQQVGLTLSGAWAGGGAIVKETQRAIAGAWSGSGALLVRLGATAALYFKRYILGRRG